MRERFVRLVIACVEVLRRQASLASSNGKLRTRLGRERKEHRRELERVKTFHQRRAREVKQAAMRRLQLQRQRHEGELQALSERHQSEVEELKRRWRDEAGSLEVQLQAAIDNFDRISKAASYESVAYQSAMRERGNGVRAAARR